MSTEFAQRQLHENCPFAFKRRSRISEIAALNPDLDPGNLQVGTVMLSKADQEGALAVKRPPLRTGEKYYTVKSGDSLVVLSATLGCPA